MLKLLMIVLVHVDDCSIAGRPKQLIQKFKIEIQKFVQITDLGDLHWILGIEVHRIREDKRIMLSQRSYINSILRRYGFDEAKPVSTPMDTPKFAYHLINLPTQLKNLQKCVIYPIMKQLAP